MRERLYGTFLDDYGRDVLKRDNLKCRYCDLDGRIFDNWMQLSLDHVRPISSGGDPSALDNQVTCCRACNSITSRMDFGPEVSREEILRMKKRHVTERRELFREAWLEMLHEIGATHVESIALGSRWAQESYISTYRFAAKAHRGQNVPGTNFPYLSHLSMVTMEVMSALTIEEGLDGNFAVQCALLHDVIEDTKTTFDEVAEAFGQQVARGVLALSKNGALEKSKQLGDSLKRILLEPKEIWMVKLADRITNLQPPPAHWTKEKIVGYREEAIEILAKLGSANRTLAERLEQKIEQYRRYAF
jgi:hypothetical protein